MTDAGRRRRAILILLCPLLVTVAQAVFWRDGSWSFLLKVWVGLGGMALYWAWLSTPRFGSSPFVTAVTKRAPEAVLVAFLLGAFVAATLML